MNHDAVETAAKHRESGHFREAERLYRQALAANSDDPDALHGLGVLADIAGRREMAIGLIERAISIRPRVAVFHNDLGEALVRAGRRRDAGKYFRKAIELDPNLAVAHVNHGNILSERRQLDDAIASYRRAIELSPNYPEARYNLGNALKSQGKWAEAIEAYQVALKLRPGLAEAYNNLGNIFSEQADPDRAVAAYEKAIELRPKQAMGYNNLASALRKKGDLDGALAALNKAISIQGDYARAHANRGSVLRDRGEHAAALDSYRRALKIKPDLSEALLELTGLLKELDRPGEAIAAAQQAIGNQPDFAEAHSILSGALREVGQVEESLAPCKKAISLNPELPEAHNNLGNILRDQGKLAEAIDCYRRALALKPDSPSIHSNLVFTLQFCSRYSAADILLENRRWAERFEKPLLASARPHDVDRTPGRVLRIGYVCPYFRVHSAAFFMMPLLAHHDPAHVRVTCYSGTRVTDHVTAEFKQLGHTWIDSARLSDDELAERIRGDQIDILIDIALHMQDARLLVFARKPAPVQVTWLGYPGTTGLTSIDYRLSDPHLDPPDQGDELYSERSIRLPRTFWCYRPLIETPDVNALPALSSDHVTFGCFNNPHKITPETLQVWAAAMRAVPLSRLLVLAYPGTHRDTIRKTLGGGGIDPGRIEFVGRVPLVDYFRLYHRVDIGLDTVPYPGHTTTLDSLWMAVPVITLAGETAVSRGGLSILTNLGLTDWIARSAEDYVAIVRAKTGDLKSLATLRGELREKMQRSAQMNARQFASDMEAAYQQMWATYLQNSGVTAP